MDLVNFLKERSERFKDKIFLYERELPEGISYEAFDRLTDLIADGLERIGLRPGDRVAVLHPNSAQTVISYFAIFKAGCIVIPINPIYTAREIKYILNDSGAEALILHESFLPGIEKIKDEIPAIKHFIVRKNAEPLEVALSSKIGASLKPSRKETVSAGRSRGHLLHLRYDRPAEGGHFNTPQFLFRRPQRCAELRPEGK